MLFTAESFFDRMRGRRIGLIGVGVSHTALIRRLCAAGARVTARDRRERDQLGETLCASLESGGASLRLGPDYLADLNEEILFRTPGMPFAHPALAEARRKGIVVTSELELFLELCPCPVWGVTGSDGKTTTTTLIARLLESGGLKVHLGGNIGRALLPVLDEISPGDAAVTELSSFQLISMRHSPDVAVITNLAPNHLDVHADMAEYVAAKQNIFLHQNGFGRLVLNADDGLVASFAPLARGAVRFFSRRRPVENGAFVDAEGRFCLAENGATVPLLPAGQLRIPGLHNRENMLAALAAVGNMASPEAIARVAREFEGVEHRIEFVRELDGARWYNDSIATSPTRTLACLSAFSQRLILIAGGYDKKIPFDPIGPAVARQVKILILTGPTADKIESAVRGAPDFSPDAIKIIRAVDLEEAVRRAHELACPGDIVTLSPACASFDAYPNFEERGRHFKELVHKL
jgi:UDP-N-acetylmuramoylalanine--D-glutamate ligase